VAHYQAWGQAVHDGLVAAGLVQTADTGQVDWPSVNAVLGTNVHTHNEMWRFNDGRQGANPVFLNVQYGTSSSATYPYLQVQVGTGSNGTGTLTGPTSTVRAGGGVIGNTTSTPTIYAAGDGSYLTLAVGLPWTGATYPYPLLAVFLDRSRDETMTTTSDGLFFGVLWNGAVSMLGINYNSASPSQTVWQQMFSQAGQVWAPASPGLPLLLGGLHFGNMYTGSTSYALPMITTHPRVRPGFIIQGAMKGDFQAGAPTPITLAGGTHVYLPFDASADSCNPMGYASAVSSSAGLNHTLLMRYE
jgi:hypothetical protein